MKKYLLTFADSRFNNSLDRIKKQATNINYFDKIFAFNENDLDLSFKDKFKDRLLPSVRGFGYWIWKPYLISKTLNEINEGDILYYVDAGCHIRRNKRVLNIYNRLLDHSENGIICFQKPLNKELTGENKFYIERKWSKADLLYYFSVQNNYEILNSSQIVGTILIIKNNEKAKRIISEWYKIMTENYDLVNDKDSIIKNYPEFIQNRHDQSILSIICKLNNILVLPTAEIEGLPALFLNKPLLALRDINYRMTYSNFTTYKITRIFKYPFTYINTKLHKEEIVLRSFQNSNL